MKTLALYCHQKSRLYEVLLLAQELRALYNVLLLVKKGTKIPENFQKENIEILFLDVEKSLVHAMIQTKWLQKIKLSSFGMLLHELLFDIRFRIEMRSLQKLLDTKNFDFFLTPSDRHRNTLEYVLLLYFHNRNIKTILPFFYETNPEGYLSGIENDPKFTLTQNASWYQRYVFSHYKNLAYKGHHTLLAFLYRVYARHGVLSKNPWVLGAGVSDVTLVANKRQKELYSAQNPLGDYRIIGDISYKELLKNKNNSEATKLFKEHYSIGTKKVIIYALGQFMELGQSSKEAQLEMIEMHIQALVKFKESHALLLSLHPMMQKENYLFLEEKYPIKILEERLSSHLCMADIFIAHVSATLLWSTLLGIKTIVLADRFPLTTYDYLQSPFFIRSSQEIQKQFETAIIEYEPTFKEDWKILCKEEVFDTKIQERYEKLFTSLL